LRLSRGGCERQRERRWPGYRHNDSISAHLFSSFSFGKAKYRGESAQPA